jgi:DNA replication protein DnaC
VCKRKKISFLKLYLILSSVFEMDMTSSTHRREEKLIQNFSPETSSNHLGDQGIDERITLKWILKEQDVRVWAGFKWLRTGLNGRTL